MLAANILKTDLSLIIGPFSDFFQSFILEFIVRYALLVILYVKEKKSRDCLVMLSTKEAIGTILTHLIWRGLGEPTTSRPEAGAFTTELSGLLPPPPLSLSLICCLPQNNFLFSQHSSDTCTMLIQVTRCIPSGHVRVLQYRRLPQSVIFDITVLFM